VGGIARKYGLTVADLKRLNNLPGNNIRVGQKLKVSGRAGAGPSGGPAAPAAKGAGGYKVAEGDTLYGIARKNNLSVDELRKINQLEGNNLRVGQVLKLK
jgi:membrane-bound lytic murein transglycosylase D